MFMCSSPTVMVAADIRTGSTNGSELLESHVTMSVWTYPSPAAVDYAKLRFSYIDIGSLFTV